MRVPDEYLQEAYKEDPIEVTMDVAKEVGRKLAKDIVTPPECSRCGTDRVHQDKYTCEYDC